MKRFMMKLFSILLVSCLVLNSSISFSTACSIPDSSVDLTAYNQESVELLRKYNYTDEEIALLLEYDRTHPVSPPMSECSLYAVDLPQNPKEGDVVYHDTVPSLDKGRHGFDGQKWAHTSSSPLTIRQYPLRAFPCLDTFLLRQNCLHLTGMDLRAVFGF